MRARRCYVLDSMFGVFASLAGETVWCAAAACAVISATACSKASGRATSAAVIIPADAFTRPAHPLNMPITLDTARSVSADVSTDGGIVVATAADGTVFTLTIPKDALLFETTITLTPVATIEGKPVAAGGPAAAVQLDPEGLRFYAPAQLLIEPPAPLAIADQVAVGWQGSGQDVHLQALDPGARKLSMQLFHFSGAGVGMIQLDESGYYAPDTPAWGDYTPSDFENRAQQYLAELVNQQRQALLQNRPGDPQFGQKIDMVFQGYYQFVIKPLMDEAEGSCDKLSANAPKILSFGHTAEILGVASAQAATIAPFLLTALQNCWATQKAHCIVPGDSARMKEVISLARQIQLLGGSADPKEIPSCADFWGGDFTVAIAAGGFGVPEKINAHATFKLDDSTTGTTQHFVSTSEGTVTWSLEGTNPSGCSVTGGPVTVPVNPGDGYLDLTPGTPAHYSGYANTPASVTVTVTCPGEPAKDEPYGISAWFLTDKDNPLPTDDPNTIAGTYTPPIPPGGFEGVWSWTITLTKFGQ